MGLRFDEMHQPFRDSRSDRAERDTLCRPDMPGRRTRAPNPTIVTTLNIQKFIRTIPAGIEIR